ncbi:MAG TPA: glutamate racemase [Firmicutes bacterium]|nr:glutamate racemase [Bacillota bacterium]
MNLSPIGVYDSGLGGLTVVRALKRVLPGEKIIYLGDTARVPYGRRPAQEIRRFAIEITDFLVSQGAKMVVVACNTSSALALEYLRQQRRVPSVGMIDPGARAAVRATPSGRIGLIATESTIKSGAYNEAIRRLAPGATIMGVACPALVPLIEAGRIEGQELVHALEIYLEPFKRGAVDTVLLGCTHYPFIESQIRRILGPGVATVDPANEVALAVYRALNDLGLLAAMEAGGASHHDSIASTGDVKFYVTGDPEGFSRVASRLTGLPIRARKVSLTSPSSRSGVGETSDAMEMFATTFQVSGMN